ncbi:MAG: DUF4083 family protein [Deltaproteobacteria bacterium]|nr:DUF4083 family protein [Deltaproteobacteria bacterium]
MHTRIYYITFVVIIVLFFITFYMITQTLLQSNSKSHLHPDPEVGLDSIYG